MSSSPQEKPSPHAAPPLPSGLDFHQRALSAGSRVSFSDPVIAANEERDFDLQLLKPPLACRELSQQSQESYGSYGSYGSYSSTYEYVDDDDDYDDEEQGAAADDDDGASDSKKHKSAHRQQSEFSTMTFGDDDDQVKIRDLDRLQRHMESKISMVVEKYAIPPSAAMILLRNFSWDERRLADAYFCDDETKQEDLLLNCGVYNRISKGNGDSQQPTIAKPSATNRCCSICFEDDTDCYGMECGHDSFCRDCWKQFIQVDVLGRGPGCVRATCPQHKCNEVVTEEEVALFFPPTSETSSNAKGDGQADNDLLSKFRKYQLSNFVDTNKHMVWCPGPGCGRVVVASPTKTNGGNSLVAIEAECVCQTVFCLACGEAPHLPASCKAWKDWRTQDQSEHSITQMVKNTKPCPNCKVAIEKNQGCNHMRCTQCDVHFCWLCLRNWNVHGYNGSCNRYDIKKAEDSLKSPGKGVLKDLDRFLHYFDRHIAHHQAEGFAKRHRDEILKAHRESDKEAALQDKLELADKYSYTNTLRRVLDLVIECRRVLKYTYVCGFFLKDKPFALIGDDDNEHSKNDDDNNNNNNLLEVFELQQENLERFTEQLSEVSEKPNRDDFDIPKANSLADTVDQFRKKIMELGLEEQQENM